MGSPVRRDPGPCRGRWSRRGQVDAGLRIVKALGATLRPRCLQAVLSARRRPWSAAREAASANNAAMIGRLSGQLAGKAPPQVLVDVGGVGYEVDVPMSTFFNLPALGERVTLLTHFVVREDAQVLFGFLTPPERDAFRLLVKISGVGPRTALSVLSGLSVTELSAAVGRQDGTRLTKVPGIGKKTAERLLLELKGKLGPDLALPASAAATTEAGSDIVQALVALGYSERDALAAQKALPADVGVSEGIKLALKALSR
jgi:holliday junction DNA helicase RuvA